MGARETVPKPERAWEREFACKLGSTELCITSTREGKHVVLEN